MKSGAIRCLVNHTTLHDLMDLYPQSQGGRPSVQYIPIPYNDRLPILPTPKGRLISCTRRLEVAATQAKPACAG